MDKSSPSFSNLSFSERANVGLDRYIIWFQLSCWTKQNKLLVIKRNALKIQNLLIYLRQKCFKTVEFGSVLIFLVDLRELSHKSVIMIVSMTVSMIVIMTVSMTVIMTVSMTVCMTVSTTVSMTDISLTSCCFTFH